MANWQKTVRCKRLRPAAKVALTLPADETNRKMTRGMAEAGLLSVRGELGFDRALPAPPQAERASYVGKRPDTVDTEREENSWPRSARQNPLRQTPGNHRTRQRAGGVEACWGKVHDLSSDGISLGLSWHVPPGTLLTIDKLGGLAIPLRARVIHITKDVAGGWLASCKFILSLSREELHALGQPNELARLQ